MERNCSSILIVGQTLLIITSRAESTALPADLLPVSSLLIKLKPRAVISVVKSFFLLLLDTAIPTAKANLVVVVCRAHSTQNFVVAALLGIFRRSIYVHGAELEVARGPRCAFIILLR